MKTQHQTKVVNMTTNTSIKNKKKELCNAFLMMNQQQNLYSHSYFMKPLEIRFNFI